ncbi:hypothetical protein D5085_02645 [Ectothiorhodospiraceae bacterium BW-2]|nr:hypothetical protein D5085_02645 [Ectothiorhodospiraceae bacterium BW-2]
MQQINLYLPQFRKPKVTFPLGQMVAVLIAVCVAIGGYGALLWQNQQQLRQQQQQLTQQKSQKEQRNQELRLKFPPPKPDPTLITRQQSTLRQIDYRQRMIEVLQRYSSSQEPPPLSHYLVGLARQDLDSLWLTRIDVGHRGRSLKLEGMSIEADALPLYIQRLNQEPAYSGTSLEKVVLQRPQPSAEQPQSPLDPRLITFSIQTAAEGSEVTTTAPPIAADDLLGSWSAIAKTHSGVPSMQSLESQP